MAAKFPKGEGEWEIHMNSPSRSKIFVRVGMSEEFAQGLRDRDEELNGQLNEDIAETIMTILQLHATQFPMLRTAVTGPIAPREEQRTDIQKQKMIKALLRTLAQVLGVGLRALIAALFKSGAFLPGGQVRAGDEETAEKELDEILKAYL